MSRGPNRAPEHDQVLRVLKEIAEAAFLRRGEKLIRRGRINALFLENCALFLTRQNLEKEDRSFATLLEVGAKRCEITLAQPVGSSTRKPNFGRD